MQLTMIPQNSTKPGINTLIMILYTMIIIRLEFVRGENLHTPRFYTGAQTFLPCLSPKEDFYMNHIMLLLTAVGVVVNA